MSFEDIIAKVKEHPEIWLPTDRFYKNRTILNKVWADIALELDTDEDLVKKRWKHLKDQYRKELKRVATQQIVFSGWQYYESLSFIANDILHGGRNKKKVEKLENSPHTDSDDTIQLKTAGRPKKIPLKRLKKGTNVTKILNRLNEMKELIETKKRRLDDEERNDEDYLFLISLLPTIKKLSDVQKLQFRGKINDWLLGALTQHDYEETFETKVLPN